MGERVGDQRVDRRTVGRSVLTHRDLRRSPLCGMSCRHGSTQVRHSSPGVGTESSRRVVTQREGAETAGADATPRLTSRRRSCAARSTPC
jgi:hypothetical protein